MHEITDRYYIANKISKNIFFPQKNITAPKGLSFSYIFYRIFRPLCKLYYKTFKLVHAGTPWTSQASIVIFKHVLDKNMIGLEYGSGKSTIFFASKLKHVVSVEHHKSWFDQIGQLIVKNNLKNVDYRYVEKHNPSADEDSSANEMRNKLGIPKFHIRKEYFAYYNLVNEFPDNHFDFILIDGRARVECTINAMTKLKNKGILVLDNSERERYAPVVKILNKWPKVTTTNGLTDTTFWFKP